MTEQNQQNRIEWSESVLLDPNWLEEYRRKRAALYDDLIMLNSNVYIMDKIAGFPFDLFERISSTFWDCTFVSMVETNVSIIYRIVIDTGERVLTLRKLKNQIQKHFRSPEALDDFRKLLRDLDFQKRFCEFDAYFRTERNNHIAHLDLRANTEVTPEDLHRRRQITSKLKSACDLVNSYFDILCLGHGHAKLIDRYNPGIRYPDDMDPRTDIELILDRIAEDSALLNMPERDRGFWPVYRETNLSDKQIEVLNEYRLKCGLTRID